MTSSPYLPDRVDIVWLDFDPQAGREQSGRRPALVLSPARYNRLAVCCPITSHAKGYEFEVELPQGLLVNGVVLADQAKSQDWVSRRAGFICPVPGWVVAEVQDRVIALITG